MQKILELKIIKKIKVLKKFSTRLRIISDSLNYEVSFFCISNCIVYNRLTIKILQIFFGILLLPPLAGIMQIFSFFTIFIKNKMVEKKMIYSKSLILSLIQLKIFFKIIRTNFINSFY